MVYDLEHVCTADTGDGTASAEPVPSSSIVSLPALPITVVALLRRIDQKVSALSVPWSPDQRN